MIQSHTLKERGISGGSEQTASPLTTTSTISHVVYINTMFTIRISGQSFYTDRCQVFWQGWHHCQLRLGLSARRQLQILVDLGSVRIHASESLFRFSASPINHVALPRTKSSVREPLYKKWYCDGWDVQDYVFHVWTRTSVVGGKPTFAIAARGDCSKRHHCCQRKKTEPSQWGFFRKCSWFKQNSGALVGACNKLFSLTFTLTDLVCIFPDYIDPVRSNCMRPQFPFQCWSHLKGQDRRIGRP